MVLFNYENIGFLSKYSQEIYYGCLAITAIVAIVMLIFAFKKRGFLKKIWGIFLAVVVGAGLYLGSGWLQGYTETANEIYKKYQKAYENGAVQIVTGKVEDFAESDAYHKKTFTLNGVAFTVYSSYVSTSLGGSPVLYYVYSEDSSFYTSGTSSSFGHWTYVPEKCVITGNGQNLEIHYLEEDGEKRILYIKELGN